MKEISAYLREISQIRDSGRATELSYRGALEKLIKGLLGNVRIINEPKKVGDSGHPDFIVERDTVPLGFVETKNIGKRLDDARYEEQFTRYREGLDNLIITDYLRFRLYREAKLLDEVEIGRIRAGKIHPARTGFGEFATLLDNFGAYDIKGRAIKSPEELAEIMAVKARLLRDIIMRAFRDESSILHNQLKGFQKVLIHDMDEAQFADLYAQTLAYGLFAARASGKDFSEFDRIKATELIPEASPFLRWLFGEVAGPHIDPLIRLGVDNLATLMRGADVFEILKSFGRRTQTRMPLIHFYETFLAEYSPELRERRGVYYTPEPVVNFIVRAVDDLLKDKFGLAEGLADKSMVTVSVESDEDEKPVSRKFHKVQVLDPAAGTGTFLAEIIRLIHDRHFQGQRGRWDGYVDEHLIPRLNGFEILMAPYTMAHINMDLILRETRYRRARGADKRFRFYLTNALEEHHPETETFFAHELSREANQANAIKRNAPVMVVLGNPPYSVESANKGEWIKNLLKDYKQEPGGGKLKERNPKSLNDDYVKFLRYGEHLINETGEGVLAFINNHSFLDNHTFRGMRRHLLQSFDEIFIIDLHGNTRKKERSPDGSPDANVFDIMQGVSINLFVKTGKKRGGGLARVRRADLYGSRESKYKTLAESDLARLNFRKLEMRAPRYFFMSVDFDVKDEYDRGFSVKEMFDVSGSGVDTAHDSFVIDGDRETLVRKFSAFRDSKPDAASLHEQFDVRTKKGWDILAGWQNIQGISDLGRFVKPVSYRPFDDRFIFYEGKLVWRAVERISHHFPAEGDTTALALCRWQKTAGFHHVFIHRNIMECSLVSNKTSERGWSFPLYRYPVKSHGLIAGETDSNGRMPNLKDESVEIFAERLGLPFVAEKKSGKSGFAPIDVLDYIYAVLHNPNYREKYGEFLKMGIPRVPYPEDKKLFWKLVDLGGQLRELHLMKSETLNSLVTEYNIPGDNVVEGVKFQETDPKSGVGRVWINKKQHFDNVPKRAWEFRIGGYKPCQKWLKDRKGQKLDDDDTSHYQRIVVALDETAALMQKIADIAS